MNVFCRSNPVKFASPTVRLLLTLGVLPAVALGPLGTGAILIHYHHGHDVHSHNLTLNDLHDWHGDPSRQHEEHQHDGQPAEPSDNDGGAMVIVFDIPDAFLMVRGLSLGTVATAVPAYMPRAITATVNADTSNNPSLHKPSWTLAPNPRVGRTVAGILLANHALLL